jgi:hypothetical protein
VFWNTRWSATSLPKASMKALIEAWTVMGMNVFVGLRYIVWGAGEGGEAGDAGLSPEQAAADVNRLLAEGVLRR